MNRYENLMSNHDDLLIFETDKMPNSHQGFYSDGVVLIDDRLNPRKKTEVLAEEIAHHKITYGDILDDKSIYKRKFELKARRCGYELLITLDGIISAYKNGVHNLYELANYFEVTESYVIETLKHYKMKFGLSTYHKGCVIKFEPLQVFEYINFN